MREYDAFLRSLRICGSLVAFFYFIDRKLWVDIIRKYQ